MKDDQQLEQVRKRINEIDDKINDLLAQRAECAVEVKKIKGGAAVYRPKREAEILGRVAKEHTGALPSESVKAVFTEVIAACRNLEETLKVAYLGPAGSYSHEIAEKLHGKTCEFISEPSLRGVLQAVEQGRADVAVIPIENSSEGPVIEAQKLLQHTDLKISREPTLPILHNLMGKCKLEDVEVVYAHPHALGQCREWLLTNLPHANLISEASNSEAAKRAAKEKNAAAIASVEAAEIYDLDVIASTINDEPGNQTRFLVLSHDSAERTGDDKTSTIITIKDEYGSLYSLLGVFVKYKIDLTNLKSQPAKGNTHHFFIEFISHHDDPQTAEALQEIKAHSSNCKVLGSYPREGR